jgi:hypothetical protein
VAAEILQELTVQHSVAAADLGKLYRERLAATRRDLDAAGKALGGAAAAITAGPNAAPGRGLVVNDAMCAFVLGQAPVAAQIAARPGVAEAPRGRGCAGCAGGGDASLVLALAWLVTGAARRGRCLRARARQRGTAGAATL